MREFFILTDQREKSEALLNNSYFSSLKNVHNNSDMYNFVWISTIMNEWQMDQFSELNVNIAVLNIDFFAVSYPILIDRLRPKIHIYWRLIDIDRLIHVDIDRGLIDIYGLIHVDHHWRLIHIYGLIHIYVYWRGVDVGRRQEVNVYWGSVDVCWRFKTHAHCYDRLVEVSLLL